MNRFGAALAILLAAAMPASAATIVYTTDLTSAGEAQSSPGTGIATVIFDDVALTMRVQADFAGLLGNTTNAHIHVLNGPGDGNTSDQNGPVATTVPTFTGFPSGVTSGSYDQEFDLTVAGSFNPQFVTNAGGLVAAREELVDALEDERAYLNIHSSYGPGGEIRGTLVAVEAVPEPATLLLLGGALAGLGLRRRSR